MIELTGNNVVLVGIVAVIGLAALVVAGILVREVLAADEGTERMKDARRSSELVRAYTSVPPTVDDIQEVVYAHYPSTISYG